MSCPRKCIQVESEDIFVANQLRAMEAFGLRRKEAVMLQPHLSDHAFYLKITRGAKTGKEREVPIFTEHQREVLTILRHSVGIGDSLGDPKKILKQNLRRFDYVMKKIGITKSGLGVTSHGLRHGFSQNEFKRITGTDSPIKKTEAETKVSKDIDHQARLEIAESLGHSRISITKTYFGK